MTLRDYQQDIIAKVLSSASNKVIVNLPMGGGKSLIISELARHYSFSRQVVVLTETSALIDQLDAHLQINNEPPNIIKASKHRETDSNIYLIMEQSFYRDKRIHYEHLKGCVVLRDEVGKGIEGKRFNDIIKFLEPHRIIGLSGTPYDEKGASYSGWQYINGISMKELIEQGFLKKPKYFIPKIVSKIDLDKVSNSGNDYNQTEAGDLLSEQDVLNAVRTTCEQINLKNRSTLFICSTIEQAEKTYNAVRDLADGAVVHSKIKEEENENMIRKFKKGELKFLVSVSKIAIGFDAPIADTLINLRPTKVLRYWKQFGARHLRKFNGKKFGELYDFGNCIMNLGFVEEDYEPPESKELAKEKIRKLSKPIIESMVEKSDNELIEVSSKAIELYLEEINRKTQRVKEISSTELVELFKEVYDIYSIIEIANEYHRRKYEYSLSWSAIRKIEDQLNLYYEKFEAIGKEHSYIKGIKTRIKNILNNDKKLFGIYYFVEWFYEQTLEKYPWLKYQIEADEVF